jgi:nicotinic acid mononucleotide adenylyltransferase
MELKDNTSSSSATTTSSAIASSSVKTLFEPDDIYILPQHCLKVAKTNLIPAICFYNGSFVPIHAGHLSVLQDAKQYIDNLGTHELLAAYISPSHSGYIKKKLRPEEWIGTGHRLSMIYLAIKSLDWVMVDLFEIFQPCNTSLSTVMEAFLARVHSQLPVGERIDVFWLKGEDALFHTKSPDKMIRLGLQTIYVSNRGSNENTIDINNQFKSVQDYHEKLWQDIRATSSFPERFAYLFCNHYTFMFSCLLDSI